ncbi:MAG: release factor glutamine methyltransferase [Acidimicrobiia bacterium]|nr:release factor glutamine methyltransferase [Acidimicrobiia bacterium]
MSDDGTLTWRQIYAEAVDRLAASGAESAEMDARRMLEEATGAEGSEWLVVLDDKATERRLAKFDAMVARRQRGEPLQYVLGRWGFRHLDLMVDRRALIPRPETEQVADRALHEVNRLIEAEGVTYADRLPVADLGTGSGAIGLALASEQPLIDVWATDISSDALAVARANLAGIGRAGTRVRLAEGSWFEALPPDLLGQLGVIVSNPPYVAADDPLPREVAEWEPRLALVPGPTGREVIEHLIDTAPGWLRPAGALVVELAPTQAASAVERARAAGYARAESYADLTGRQRVLVARVPPS